MNHTLTTIEDSPFGLPSAAVRRIASRTVAYQPALRLSSKTTARGDVAIGGLPEMDEALVRPSRHVLTLELARSHRGLPALGRWPDS